MMVLAVAMQKGGVGKTITAAAAGVELTWFDYDVIDRLTTN